MSGLLRRPFSTHFYSRPCGRGDQYRRSRQPARCSYFYSRPCGRGDRRKPAAARPLPYFYSRPCGRGDSFVMEIMAFSTLFLLTPLREGRRLPGQRGLMACGISTHAPAGGATSRLACLFVRAIDFYSRPCGRGDEKSRCKRKADHISTHAPAGGATLLLALSSSCVSISTHAPAGGATLTLSSRTLTPSAFLLTPLREGRPRGSGAYCTSGLISTHAPAGGATRVQTVFISKLENFYSRPCGRGDRPRCAKRAERPRFLLTPLREGRRRRIAFV